VTGVQKIVEGRQEILGLQSYTDEKIWATSNLYIMILRTEASENYGMIYEDMTMTLK
jgi:hypothetical protein